MPRSYAPQLRTMVVEQVRSGRRAGEMAAGLGFAKQQRLRWVGQDKRPWGAGQGCARQSRRCCRRARIAWLEAELATVKRACLVRASTDLLPRADQGTGQGGSQARAVAHTRHRGSGKP